MTTDPFTHLEARKQADLRRMKHVATGLLILMALIYIGCQFYHDVFWLGFIESAAEAAMVGALADWFAVTALFRYPLGVRIPHTAIIPRRKDAIADQFGMFVQQNFLSESVVSSRLASLDLSRQVADWLVVPKNAATIADHVAAIIAGMTSVVRDAEVQAMIERGIEHRVRTTSFTPVIGEILSFVTSGRRQQALFDGAVNVVLTLLDDSGDELQVSIQRQTPWWFPESVDAAIYRRLMRSITKTLYEMQTDIHHPMRVHLVNRLERFLDDLKHSKEFLDKEAALKEDLLQQSGVTEFTASLWHDIKQMLLRQDREPDAEFKKAIESSVIRFGESIREDPALAAKINRWADESARYLIRTYGHEVADLISNTIAGWDPDATSERIEIQIGRDLQFIRINGTIVGGLVGLLIHTLSIGLPMIGPWA